MTKWHGGKGSARRKGANDDLFAQNYDKIFGKKKEQDMIEIWGKPACPSCTKAKQLCETRKLEYVYKELGKDFEREEVFETFPGARTFPQIIVGGNKVGGFESLVEYLENTGYTGTGHTL